jgi:hypothetical protein
VLDEEPARRRFAPPMRAGFARMGNPAAREAAGPRSGAGEAGFASSLTSGFAPSSLSESRLGGDLCLRCVSISAPTRADAASFASPSPSEGSRSSICALAYGWAGALAMSGAMVSQMQDSVARATSAIFVCTVAALAATFSHAI